MQLRVQKHYIQFALNYIPLKYISIILTFLCKVYLFFHKGRPQSTPPIHSYQNNNAKKKKETFLNT